MKNENLLTLINVHKSYGSNVVLSGLSLKLDKGQFWVSWVKTEQVRPHYLK
ncbi:MAG: hypothetical protein LBF12_04425 [Christensenellaceae bacterium]|jgi:ABC-type histidine transport system ATPase subunit|nr:hypothetical protein [Christensenellaceae bacterium]